MWKFQFHSGTIKSRPPRAGGGYLRGFNSIVVRLKVKAGGMKAVLKLLFQFHSGSIKRKNCCFWSRMALSCFNSIVVRLKDGIETYSSSEISCFNSIVVRLKVSTDGDVRSVLLRFNSIVVRLKGLCGRVLWPPSRRFNSIVVRLKGQYRRTFRIGKHVSIP